MALWCHGERSLGCTSFFHTYNYLNITPPPKATHRVGDKVHYKKCHQFTTTTTLFFPSSKYYVKKHPLPCHDTSILHEICVSHCLWLYTDTTLWYCGGLSIAEIAPNSFFPAYVKMAFFLAKISSFYQPHHYLCQGTAVVSLLIVQKCQTPTEMCTISGLCFTKSYDHPIF